MVSRRWSEASWSEIEATEVDRMVTILPIGALEAHGPHLPTGTDNLIAEAMAEKAAVRLARRGFDAYVLPTLAFTAAPFAGGFRGTVSIRSETVTALIVEIGRALAVQGVPTLAIANAHFDPTNLRSIWDAVETINSNGTLRSVFPDVTRKPWAQRLTDEFKSGACHAGRYESSVVLALRADLVDEARRLELPENPISLSEAIAAGERTFEEIGGREAYFGDPAAATPAEGRQTIAVLGSILEEAVVEALGPIKS